MTLDPYICITCGTPAGALFKEYSSGVLKLCQCEVCMRPVDSYIEKDISIILVDTALQRLEAYRHLLHNAPLERKWKFSIICLLCDAYMKWVSHRMEFSKSTSYFQLEWTFYMALILALIENIVFCTCLVGFLFFLVRSNFSCTRFLGNLVAVSGCAKLFTVPAILWGWNEGHINYFLVNSFLLVSIIQTCRATSGVNRMQSAMATLTSFAVMKYIEHFLNQLVLGQVI